MKPETLKQYRESNPEVFEGLDLPDDVMLLRLYNGEGSRTLRRRYADDIQELRNRLQDLETSEENEDLLQEDEPLVEQEPENDETPEEEDDESVSDSELDMFWEAILAVPIPLKAVKLPGIDARYDHSAILKDIGRRHGIEMSGDTFIPGKHLEL